MRQTRRQTITGISLSALSDEPKAADGYSPRLDALLSRLPTYTRTRADFAIYRSGARTLAALCTKTRADLLRCKNVGKKSIADLKDTLSLFDLTLAERPMKHAKDQTPAQRVANATWLRRQISDLIADCDENIAEDQARADKERDDARRARYEASVDCHRHWRKQLARILAGKTSTEGLADTLSTLGVEP